MTAPRISSCVSHPIPGVLWLTGRSGAGKTTVGRKVAAILRRKDRVALHLDGDDIRGMLGHRWEYGRSDREELARAYFRICSYLAAQDCTVVLSAVALYEGVRAWAKANIPNVFQIYLDVPVEERVRRDRQTKNVLSKIGETKDLYDEPTAPDLRVMNYGDVTSDIAAEQVVNFYLHRLGAHALDHGKSAHWDRYYTEASHPTSPTSFAEFAASELIRRPCRLLEMGCGTGRDAAFFSSRGYEVVGVDPSAAAIAFCQREHATLPAVFLTGTVGLVQTLRLPPFDVVYSRFVLHAMTEAEEVDTLTRAHSLLREGGRLLIECRSVNDPLMRQGEIISSTERIAGHYRRFIVLEELAARLSTLGFLIESAIECKGLAVWGDDDPVVIRMVARKSDRPRAVPSAASAELE